MQLLCMMVSLPGMICLMFHVKECIVYKKWFFSLLDPRNGFQLGFIKGKGKLIYLS